MLNYVYVFPGDLQLKNDPIKISRSCVDNCLSKLLLKINTLQGCLSKKFLKSMVI